MNTDNKSLENKQTDGVLAESSAIVSKAAPQGIDNSAYEEGTWTPVVQGSSTQGVAQYTVNNARYVRTGNMITAFFNTSGKFTTAPAGMCVIKGLPYQGDNNANGLITLGIGYAEQNVYFNIEGNTLVSKKQNGKNSDIVAASFGTDISNTNFHLYGNISYFVGHMPAAGGNITDTKLDKTGGIINANNQWGGLLEIGRKGTGLQTNTLQANVGSTDGNLHLDAGKNKNIYLNYYQPHTGTGLATNGSLAVFLNGQNGNVGVGTVNPTQKLHVVGNGVFTERISAHKSTIPNRASYKEAGIMSNVTQAEHMAGYRPGYAFHASNVYGMALYADNRNTLKKIDDTGNITTIWDSGNLPYEKGLWTPILSGEIAPGAVTYTIKKGTYIRIGSQITVFCYVKGTIQTKPTGQVSILGLPFPCDYTSADIYSSALQIGFSKVSMPKYGYTGLIDGLASKIVFGKEGLNESLTALTWDNLEDNEFQIHFQLTYIKL